MPANSRSFRVRKRNLFGVGASGCVLKLAGLAAVAVAAAADPAQAADRLATYANPVDLPYRYQPPSPIRKVQPRPNEAFREAADPTIVLFKNRYWLFASHSKGYWHSSDMRTWSFIEPTGYDVDRFAPTVVVMGGKMYLATSESPKHSWVTDDPMSGQWRQAAAIPAGYQDPALLLDDDGRLYLYHGLAAKGPLHAEELDPKTLQPIAKAEIPQSRSKETRGWEVPGDYNENLKGASYVEGAWMTKHKGRYYLEYSAPGTEFKTYANGLLAADKPMGPFVYQDYSPFAVKPTGFITGAGHGNTFKDMDGRGWHSGTMTISQRHIFERRLALFPTSFTRSGELIADTYLGDYPRYMDGDRRLTGWMLLSRKKAVAVSSTLDSYAAENAVDEDVRTWWSAKTAGPDEWFQVDLGAPKRIEAVQINFADQGAQALGISKDVYNYVLELSSDGRTWRTVVDRSRSGRDAPHDYQVLPKAERARFVRLRNMHSPDGGKFSLSDLRVFGQGGGAKPGRVDRAEVQRDPADGRRATVNWRPARGAEFYVVRLGVRPDLMNQNYQVYDGQASLVVPSLNTGVGYCFVVDSVNENGVTRGGRPTCIG
jgi:xylan 1,4-beta-xylosidase